MRIVKILECSSSLRSNLRNAFIDFSRMTLSVVAVVTDVVREGRPVVGFGFNSNGRYAQGGVLRERLIPRILEAEADSLLDASGENFDPARVHACMLRRVFMPACCATRSPVDTVNAHLQWAPSTRRSGTPSPRSRRSPYIRCSPNASTAAVTIIASMYIPAVVTTTPTRAFRA
jgi:hypothetical protein